MKLTTAIPCLLLFLFANLSFAQDRTFKMSVKQVNEIESSRRAYSNGISTAAGAGAIGSVIGVYGLNQGLEGVAVFIGGAATIVAGSGAISYFIYQKSELKDDIRNIQKAIIHLEKISKMFLDSNRTSPPSDEAFLVEGEQLKCEDCSDIERATLLASIIVYAKTAESPDEAIELFEEEMEEVLEEQNTARNRQIVRDLIKLNILIPEALD